jgi:hypothetical protein
MFAAAVLQCYMFALCCSTAYWHAAAAAFAAACRTLTVKGSGAAVSATRNDATSVALEGLAVTVETNLRWAHGDCAGEVKVSPGPRQRRKFEGQCSLDGTALSVVWAVVVVDFIIGKRLLRPLPRAAGGGQVLKQARAVAAVLIGVCMQSSQRQCASELGSN